MSLKTWLRALLGTQEILNKMATLTEAVDSMATAVAGVVDGINQVLEDLRGIAGTEEQVTRLETLAANLTAAKDELADADPTPPVQ